MASSDARDVELARLSGSELVERLRTTCRLADYEAAARLLDARDARLARVEAALAEAKEGLDARDRRLATAEAALAKAMEILNGRGGWLARAEAKEGQDALREYDALKDRGPVNEDARGEPRSEGARPGDAIAAPAPAPRGERSAEVAEEKGTVVIDLCSSDDDQEERKVSRGEVSGVSRKRKATASEVGEEGRRARATGSACSSDDEDDTLTLSQLMKKRDGAQPGADKEPKNAVRPLRDYLSEASLVIKEEVIEATIGGSNEPKVANFVQGRGNVKSGDNSGVSRGMLSPPPPGFAARTGSQKNLSKADHLVMRISRKEGSLGNDLPKTPVITERPETTVGGGSSTEPKMSAFVLGRGNMKPVDNSGVSRGMMSPPPPGFAAKSGSRKNFSKADHIEVRISGKEGSLGNDLLKSSVITDRPETTVGGSNEPKVVAFVQGRGNVKSVDNGGVYRAMLSAPPLGFAARTGSQKNLSKADHGGPRIAGKDDSFAGQEKDTLVQGRNLSLSARIVESARAGAVSPKGHTGSALGGNMALGLEAIREQEKTNGGGHNAKLLPGTNAIKEQVRGGMVVRAIGEQDETNGLVHKRYAMPVTNGEKKRGKLSSCQRRETNDGGHLRTTEKQLGSSTLLPRNEPHSRKTSVGSSLPAAVTRNWKYETDMFTSCIENKELCMQAACALYRQQKLMFQLTEGGQSGNSGLCERDAHRVAKLVEFLLDGNIQGPLKRTAEELVKHDSTGPSFLEKVVCQFHDQLFYIYKNKEDPYFR